MPAPVSCHCQRSATPENAREASRHKCSYCTSTKVIEKSEDTACIEMKLLAPTIVNSSGVGGAIAHVHTCSVFIWTNFNLHSVSVRI